MIKHQSVFINKDDKCYNFINNILINIHSMAIALSDRKGESTNFKQGENIVLEGLSSPYEFILPLNGPFDALIHGKQPDCIEISYNIKRNTQLDYSAMNLDSILNNTFSYNYIQYYESCQKQFFITYGNHKKLWPDIVRFAENVRNALSHNGKVHITKERRDWPDSRWYASRFGYENNDEMILGRHINSIDLLHLILELDLHKPLFPINQYCKVGFFKLK